MFKFFRSQIAYTVHEQPNPPADREERAERLKFVREGFSLFAFLLPPLWMLSHRLWLVFFFYLLVVGAINGGLTLFEISEHWRYYAMMALSLLVGFEADVLERWTLDRRGWRMIATVSGANYEECERRFFETWVPTVPMVSPSNFDKPGNFEAAGQAQPSPRDGDLIPPKRGWQSAGTSFPRWRRWQQS